MIKSYILLKGDDNLGNIDKSKLKTWDELKDELEYEANRPRTLRDHILDTYYFFWRVFDNIKSFVKNFPYNLLRLFYWLPIIWKDRWYDRNYLFIILEHKLRYDGMRYIKENYTVSVDARERGNQILRCAELCKRLKEDDYYFVIEESYKQVGIDIKENRKEIYEMERKAIQKDLDELFNTMKNNVMGWWD